jgi:hypothetical protein
MKKVFLIIGVVVALVALAGGLTAAYADGNGNGGSGVDRPCDERQSWVKLARQQTAL